MKTRAELATQVPSGGIVIELGVAAGQFAAELITANPSIHYIGIDRWGDHHDETERINAVARITALCPRAELVKSTFRNALPLFGQPATADMIYIDGYAHTGQEGGETLRDWWAALKPGGIFAGHDYCQTYSKTIEAVDDFIRSLGMSVTTNLNIIDESPHPSWWIKKPK